MAEKLDKDDVLSRVKSKTKECVGWSDTKLSRERQIVTEHYNSRRPFRQHPGSSSYISTDVYDAVEAMKAQLLETFAANDDEIVKFPPLGQDDIESSRVATEYCSYVIHRENDGYGLFRDVIHDGLTMRVGVAKVFWEEITDYEDHEFGGITYADVQALTAQEDVDELTAEATPASVEMGAPLFKGTMRRKIDRSKVTLLAIPAEEFLISPRATCIEDADMIAHRTLKTRAELKEMYPKFAKKIDEIGTSDDKILDTSPEVLSRFEPVDSGTSLDMSDAIQPELAKIMFYEAYTCMDLRDGKGARLYKFCYAADILFSHEEVDRAPFLAFVPLPVPHAFFGNNFAQRVIPTQNARTVLTRAVLDHASTTTNPRWTVLKGGLLNPKEMLDNRLSGLVNITRPDAVRALEQQPLNPFVFQTIEMLKSNKEESTGISALSQGMNPEAISTQNSQGLVQDLVTLSQQRQKIIARNFAHGFLIPLYREVYRLVLENEKKEKVIEIAGNYAPVTVDQWRERRTCKASVNLGYGERGKEAGKYAQAYTMLAQDPALGPMFGPKNRYAMLTDGMKVAGFENYAKYLTPPEQVQPPQPDPLKVKELEIKEKLADAAFLQAQAAAGMKTMQAQVNAAKEARAEQQDQLQAALDRRESERLDIETANRVDVAQREMDLAESSPEPNTIVSANG